MVVRRWKKSVGEYRYWVTLEERHPGGYLRLLWWGPYLGKWATDRKKHPIEDIMAASDWRDRTAAEESYLQAGEETPLAVVLEERKLRRAE